MTTTSDSLFIQDEFVDNKTINTPHNIVKEEKYFRIF